MTFTYEVFDSDHAREKGFPDSDELPAYDPSQCLYEMHDGAPVRLVFCDRMEPEDATLDRDLRPLVKELNTLAKRIGEPL